MQKRVIFAVIIFSGAASLVYEIIWIRLLLLVFGSTTHSVVAVLSAYMAGLAIGSYLFGRIADKHTKLLRLYGILECAIGITALLTLPAIPIAQSLYAGIYHLFPSPELLFVSKFILTSIILLPATIAMGGTLPILITYFSKTREAGSITGKLYALNTLGAVTGTLLTGFVFIELLGLSSTVIITGVFHVIIGGILILLFKSKTQIQETQPVQKLTASILPPYPKWKQTLALFVFGISGLTAMAYEVAWTRLLTPTVGTYIYAFSLILAVVLSGITIGSALAGKFLAKTTIPLALLGMTQIGMWMGAVLSIFANSQLLQLGTIATVLSTILPSAICMGMTFAVIAKIPHTEESRGRFIGTAYAANTLGSLIGPAVAGFVLLKYFGTIHTILMLALINGLAGAALLFAQAGKKQRGKAYGTAGIITLGIIGITALLFVRSDMLLEKSLAKRLEQFQTSGYTSLYKEDETAAVLGFRNKNGSDYGLLVDGVGMTVLVDETKMMAHIPLLTHPNPKDMLVIAFGMGTTFRSALSYGINVDAVELVPSVPNTFGVFFPDAREVLANPKGNVIINDGRNYVRLTDKKYDVISVDPPPPVNAAGTSVLYSREFYQDGKKILKPGGLFAQWLFYGTRHDDFQMLAKSFIDVFPYVAVFHSPRQIGVYLIGSDSPINHNGAWVANRIAQPLVTKDITEWGGNWTPTVLDYLYFGDRALLDRYTQGVTGVSDDHPKTEYFLLRQKLSRSPIARDEVLADPPGNFKM